MLSKRQIKHEMLKTIESHRNNVYEEIIHTKK